MPTNEGKYNGKIALEEYIDQGKEKWLFDYSLTMYTYNRR